MINEDITVLLLTHKSKNLAIRYIKNLYKKFRIIIIDNSNDTELKSYINTYYPEITIKFIENNGYGAQINYGSKLIKTKYFLISNPDLEGIDENNLNKFLKAAVNLKDKFSALGPRYLKVDPKSIDQTDPKKKIAELKILHGACMFFNKKNFDIIGGFDENFFLYFEENDFCLRSYKFNKNYQINSIKVVHDGGNSVHLKNINEKVINDNFRSWHFMWSKFYFYKKRYSFLLAILFFIPIILRLILRIALHFIIGDKKYTNKYKARLFGLSNSIIGKKSFFRID